MILEEIDTIIATCVLTMTYVPTLNTRLRMLDLRIAARRAKQGAAA